MAILTPTADGWARAPPPASDTVRVPGSPPQPPASARGKKGGGAGKFPYRYSHRSPLTCPTRPCRERKISQSTSWERLGLQLRSRLLSPLLERLSSTAAAMTPSQATPATTNLCSQAPLLLSSRADDVKTQRLI